MSNYDENSLHWSCPLTAIQPSKETGVV